MNRLLDFLRYLGSIMVRNAIRRKERAEDENRQPGRIDTWLSGLAASAGKADKLGKLPAA